MNSLENYVQSTLSNVKTANQLLESMKSRFAKHGGKECVVTAWTNRRNGKMNNLKFNGVLKEIKNQYPNIELTQFLSEVLQLPNFKAEELAARIEKEYLKRTKNKIEPTLVRTILQKTNKSEFPPKTSAYSVDCLSEKEFEVFIKWLFEELGYNIHPENHPTYLGVDFIATKDCEKIAIQARRFPKTHQVSDSVVLLSQETKRIYGCQRSIVLITTYFTPQAIIDAQSLNVELWDKYTLSIKIDEVRRKAKVKEQEHFPQYNGSLLQTLLKFEETVDFFIEPRTGGRYDIHLPGVKFPLLTFQAHADKVIRCIYRIRNNKPVGEHEGTILISIDHDNNRVGPDEIQAYTLIIQYLEQFLS
jgi:HJR/Mrr/RecB family endonuclease